MLTAYRFDLSQERSIADDGSKGSDRLASIKNVLSIIREGAILLVLLLLLVFPGVLNDRLVSAGFTEADVAGFRWESAQDAVEETGRAAQQVEAIGAQMDSLRQELDELAATAQDSSTQDAVRAISARADSLGNATATTRADLTRSLTAQQRVLEAETPTAEKNSGQWGIVVSADRALEPALYEFDRVVDDRAAYLVVRGGWYRTVVPFDSRQSAENALAGLRTGVRDSAYIVRLDDWCRQAIGVAPGGRDPIECS